MPVNGALDAGDACPRPPAPGPDLQERLARLERRVKRESKAREEAERLLEKKSLELHEASVALRAVNADLTEKMAEIEDHTRRAEHAALHDEVTGLPNRRAISERLRRMAGHDFSIVMFDLDNFKHVNDTLGHAAGDDVLCIVARALNEICPPDAFCARFGGDEFVVILPGNGDETRPEAFGHALLTDLSSRVSHTRGAVPTTLSVGTSRCHESHSGPDDTFLEADLALYAAKAKGRACAVVFDEDMRAQARRRRQLSDLIFEGLRERQFAPHYMPRVDAATGALCCVEALARWTHPREGAISPADFLKVAEDIGQLQNIDRLILENAVTDLRAWDAAGVGIPKVSVNVSSRRLMDPGLLPSVKKLRTGPGRIGFELLETVFLDNANTEVLRQIEGLRWLGVGIEIDDFGSGHASINGLLSVRPDALKIDSGLVIEALGNPQRIDLLSSVVAIGRALDITVVAEGVETRDHVDLCRRIGCDQLQGYAIGKPMPADTLLEWHASHQAQHGAGSIAVGK